MHSNLLLGTLSYIINVYSSRTRLLFIFSLNFTTSLIEVCVTVTLHGPGVREVSIPFLDAYSIPS